MSFVLLSQKEKFIFIIKFLVILSNYLFDSFYNSDIDALLNIPSTGLTTNFLVKLVDTLNPIKVYNNFEQDRLEITKNNKNKSGIYCLVNVLNGKFYLGSSKNLSNRLRSYLNTNYLLNKKNQNMPIAKALLKYGQSKFAVLILEYIDFEDLRSKESFYIKFYKPYYNVLSEAYSSKNYKHSQTIKARLSDLAKKRKHSESTKILISKALSKSHNPFYKKSHTLDSKLKMIQANSKNLVYIYNSFKILLVIFPSVRTLSKFINSNSNTIQNYIINNNLFRGE